MSKSWYILHTYTGYENKIEKTIAGVFVKYGMDRQKEQMMKDAIDTRIDKRLADMIGYTGSERAKVIIVKDND